jgi:LmbE family N-acetylglucosaminyl deacetylase
MVRLLKQALSVNALRKTLGFGNVYAATKFDFSVQYNPTIEVEKVLVLAPHPDDESFGMGGTIKKMTTAGSTVTVVFLADGSLGVPLETHVEEELEKPPKPNKNLAEIRKDEARRAAEILGITEIIFWGHRDGKLAASHSAVKALTDLITQSKPDIIFLPSFLDNHSDHRATNEIFINATTSLPDSLKNFEVWAYEIWTPIFVNRIVDITLYTKTKEEAIRGYESQLKARRYDKAIMALNQYRAEINDTQGFCEGFFASNLELYKELYRKAN